MTQYIMVYLGGNQPATPEEGKQHFIQYQAWLSELGDAAVSPANPLKDTVTVHADGVVAGGACAMSGYTIINADSLDIAIKHAQACPFLAMGGSMEVSELIQMPF